MSIRPAGPADIPALVDLRLRLFEETDPDNPACRSADIRAATEAFFRQHLDSALAKSWVAEQGGHVVASATLAFFSRPPYPGNLSGLEAYLLNMYTEPATRQQGIASALLHAALDHAQARGCARVWLNASAAGRPLYEKNDFVAIDNAMELIF